MADLPTPSQITDLAALLAPGLIMATIRTRAITGSLPDFKDRVIAYGVISTAYFAVVTPLFHVPGGVPINAALWSLLQYGIVPVLLGIASAYLYQTKLSYRIADYARLHLAHHLPASWDYAFENLPETTYILVTLDSGSQVAGRWARGSFASSSKDERDLLIGEMWDVGEEGAAWTPLTPPRSILICGKDIRHIEFFGAS